jgi:hypothetical protein
LALPFTSQIVHFLDPSRGEVDARPPNDDEAAVLTELQHMITTPFEEAAHAPLLRELWEALHPPHPADADEDDDDDDDAVEGDAAAGGHAAYARSGEGWQEVGFQHTDPASDVRGGGELALANLLHFAAHHTEVAIPMCRSRTEIALSTGGEDWPSYPWATAGINLTQLLSEICHVVGPHGTRGDFAGAATPFWHVIRSLDDFHELYSMAFVLLDCLFDEMDATYMRFHEVLAATRERLTAVLAQAPASIDDVRVALRISILRPLAPVSVSEMHKQASHHGNTFAFAPIAGSGVAATEGGASSSFSAAGSSLMAGWLLKLPVQDPSKRGEHAHPAGFWSRMPGAKRNSVSLSASHFPQDESHRSDSTMLGEGASSFSINSSLSTPGATSVPDSPPWKWQRRFFALEDNGTSGPTLMYFKSALTPPQRRIGITAESVVGLAPTDR